jgi:hypothetical protein
VEDWYACKSALSVLSDDLLSHLGVVNRCVTYYSSDASYSSTFALRLAAHSDYSHSYYPTLLRFLHFSPSSALINTHDPQTGIYTSSKAALHAIVDTYTGELRPFGIKVLGVQPGGFRTNTIRLASYENGLTPTEEATEANSLKFRDAVEGGQEAKTHPIDEIPAPLLSPRTLLPHSPSYLAIEAYRPHAEAAQAMLLARAGKELGDPRKAVKVIVDVVLGELHPLDTLSISFPSYLYFLLYSSH